MKTPINEITYVILLTAACFMINIIAWPIPWILLLPILLAYTIENPLAYLTTIAVTAELLTGLPVGIMVLVVFLPWLIKKTLGQPEIDINFTFPAVLIVTTTSQVISMFLPDIYNHATLAIIPWLKIIPTILLTSSIAFLISIAVRFNRSW